MGYASTLGDAYIEDEYEINDGYPILEWELCKVNIAGKAYVNIDEGKIVVEIIHHKYNIIGVENENGTPLTKVSDTIYTEPIIDGTHTYTITDNEGNQIKLKLGPIKVIDSANALNKFRDAVNKGTNNFAGYTVIQTADIDMSSVCGESIDSWVPIGINGYDISNGQVIDEYSFAGTYDGGYHTISNLYINSNQYNFIGLFAQTTSNTIIKNLVMENIYLENRYTTISTSLSGGIVGLNFGTIEQCGIESGNIKTIKQENNTQWGGAAAGGISGSSGGKIDKCYNKADIYAESTSSNYGCAFASGIVSGITTTLTATNCYNTGEISIKGGYFSFVGGMIGDKYNYNGVVIKNCYNVGELIATDYTNRLYMRRNTWKT